MDVKPWEPVSFRYELSGRMTYDSLPYVGPEFPFFDRECCDGINKDWSAHITLANNQRIIVRALSKDRKAARAFERRVSKAVEANR